MAAPCENVNTSDCSTKSTVSAWNSREISPPPTVTCSYDIGEYEKASGKPEQYCEVLSNISATSKHIENFLASERFTLTRLLYKLHNQQNRFKWYQLMNKIDKVLVRIDNLNLTRYVDELKECCQKSGRSSWRMCSRQMLEYFLVKLMSITKLCGYATALCEKTAVFLVQFLSHGHFVNNNLVFCSLISRIWVLLESLLSNSIKWYDKLYPWCDKLKHTAVPWIPSDECLPESLSTWLASEDVQVNRAKRSKSQKFLSKWFTEQEKSNTSESQVLDSTSDDIQLDTSAILDLGERIPVSERRLLPEGSGISLKGQRAVKKRTLDSNGTEVEMVTNKSSTEEHDAMKEVISHLEVGIKSKKRKKRKVRDDAREQNYDAMDDSHDLPSVPVDDSDVSQDPTQQSATDVTVLELDTCDIPSPKKKMKRKLSDATTLKSKEDAPTSKKKKKRTREDEAEPALAGGKVWLSPSNVKKIEKDIMDGEELILDSYSNGGDKTLPCRTEVDAQVSDGVKKTKKKKKKKRKSTLDESQSGPVTGDGNSIEVAPIDASSNTSGQETGGTLNEQELEAINADVTSLFGSDDAPVKAKRKKKRKRKSGLGSGDVVGEDDGPVSSETTELSPGMLKKIEMDIVKTERNNNAMEVQGDTGDDGIRFQKDELLETSVAGVSKKKKKKRKRKSNQVKTEIGGPVSIPSSSEMHESAANEKKDDDGIETDLPQLAEVCHQEPVSAKKKRKKRKKLTDSVLRNEDIAIISEQVRKDASSVEAAVDDDQEGVLPKKKSKKKKRKHKKSQLQEELSSEMQSESQSLVCELGQIKHQTTKKKGLSNVTDIDDIFSALEF